MAVTQNSFTGNGSTTNFSFTFPYIKQADVKAKIDGVNTTAFTLANATTVSFTSAPASGAAIIIFRDTDNDEKTATFFAGSAVKAEDLNSNFDQVLFTAQEVDNNALQSLGGTMTGDLNFGQNANIVFEGATDDANETTLTVADPTADRTITLPNVTGTVITTGDTGTVATGMIADSAITSAKITDGTIATGDIADDAITTAKISDANVTTALIQDASVTTAKLASDAVTTAKITDANVTTAKIANDAITAAKIAADAVGSSEIAANAVTSSELADASVDTAAIVDANVTTAKVADSAITTAKINDSAITSAKIGANQVVEGKIADNAVTTAKIPDSGVTTPKIADNAVTNVKLADAELRELATMGSTTASALADLTQAEVQILDGATVSTNELNILDGVTANATEINQLDGNTLTNSFTASSTTQYPSSNAISGYVLGLMDNLGGFVAIANENSFPTTNPDPSDDAGTVVSISDAGGLVVSASGTASGQTTGGTAVTITGFPSALQSSTLPAGQGLQVVSTSTLNTYTYHKVLGTDADIAQLNDDVNDFFARYRIGSTNPTTDLDAGDLFFNTSTGKMLVYDATVTAWEEVQAVGNYFINTLSSSGGTGGGSATFNGSAYRFTLSNPGSVAQQHIVSINGVIQKPNSGTSQPSEGFAIDNADIILAAAPATGSEFFIVTVGTSVNIGSPSNDTINNAMVKADAAIAGTKISPNFGSQNVVTTGSAGIGTSSPGTKLDVNDGSANCTIRARTGTGFSSFLNLLPNGSGSGVSLAANSNSSAQLFNQLNGYLAFGTNNTERMRITSAGNVGIGNTNPSQPLDVTGWVKTSVGLLGTYGRVGLGNSGGPEITTGALANPIKFIGGNGSSNLERMRIDSSGRLLVGLTSDLSGGTSSTAIQLATTGGGFLGLARNDTTVGTGNPLGGLRIYANDPSGYNDVGIIQCAGDGSHSSGDYPTRWEFYTTAENASSPTERMRIGSNGRVGIGVTAPSAALEINDPNSGDTYLRLSGLSSNTADANYAGIEFYNTDSSGIGPGVQGWIEARATGSTGAGCDLVFGTYPGVSSPEGARGVERMRIAGDSYIRLSSSAGGIQFNGDTAAANALDDYEEGDWNITNAGDSTGVIASSHCKYTKIGRVVICHFVITVSANFTGSSLGGLPFHPVNKTGSPSGVHGIIPVRSGGGGSGAFFFQVNTGGTLSTLSSTSGGLATLSTSTDPYRGTFAFQI